MKLYSRGQVFLWTALGALITALIAVGIGFFRFPAAEVQNAGEIAAQTDAPEAVREVPLGGITLRQSESNILQQNTAELQTYTADERENISVYEQMNEAVVNITTKVVALDWFLQAVPQDGDSGSGSIIDTRGYVLTNNHVISNAREVYVTLYDGQTIRSDVVGIDSDNDLAVLRFEPPKGVELKTIPFGESGNLKVGQKVLAIGNPFAYERTLTTGIVSGLGRAISISRNHIIMDMIQTDAAINPGNSGGPLLDTRGRMIGVTTLISSPSGGSVGVGFAIPINTAKRVVAEIIETGKVKRGWIDATVVQLNSTIVNYAKLPIDSGLLVSRTQKNGLSEKAGLKQGDEPVRYGSGQLYLGGDIIVKVDGMKTATLADLFSALEDNKPGEKVQVVVNRNGKEVTLTIPLADREEFINQ